MRGMKLPNTQQTRPQLRPTQKMPADLLKHDLMLRRAVNHNVHVITPHGKVQLGRKGRSG